MTPNQRIAAVLQALFEGGKFQIPPEKRQETQDHITALARADDPPEQPDEPKSAGLFDSAEEEADELAKGNAAYAGVTIEGAPISDDALAAAHDEDDDKTVQEPDKEAETAAAGAEAEKPAATPRRR